MDGWNLGMVHKSLILLRRITFGLSILASIGVEAVVHDIQDVAYSLGFCCFWLSLALILNSLIHSPVDPKSRPPYNIILIVFLSLISPFLVEPLLRQLFDIGHPLEVQLVFSLRNTVLFLAACSGWLICMRLACFISVFLILFTVIMTDHWFVYIILVPYVLVVCLWLALNHLFSSETNNAFITIVRIIKIPSASLNMPWLWLLLLLFSACCLAAFVLIAPDKTLVNLGELLPTSGGTGSTDPFARSGVGDGPEEIAGDRARSTGMVETDKLIEDNKSALIDAISDLYGPPHKSPEDIEQMVAAGWMDIIQFHGKLPENRRPSRAFDIARKGPQRHLNPETREARALFEVEGRTPLHIRAMVFDYFESNRWREARKPITHMIEIDDGDWMRPAIYRDADWYAEFDSHRIKIADLKNNLVPTPSLLTRFRIHKVNRPHYYDWLYDGVLALAGRQTIPSGIIVHTESHTIDSSRIPETAFSLLIPQNAANVDANSDIHASSVSIKQFAEDWASGLPRGWPQIEAIITRLRNEYELDVHTHPPSHHPQPVIWFLKESRRGPDYLFATSAALLLRQLNYTTRFCIGYYVSPIDYDPESGHTPVRKTNLHSWAEVRLRDGHWLVVEATPGYEILPPKLSYTEHLLNALLYCLLWVKQNGYYLIASLILSLFFYRKRHELFDTLFTYFWYFYPGNNWREYVLRALLILERRGCWVGMQRPHFLTRHSWLLQLTIINCMHDVRRLSIMVDWATYAPNLTPPWSESDVLFVCRRVISGCSLRRWRNAIRSKCVSGA